MVMFAPHAVPPSAGTLAHPIRELLRRGNGNQGDGVSRGRPHNEAGTVLDAAEAVFEHQSPEVRAGMVVSDDPTNPCKSPYMPEVLVITL